MAKGRNIMADKWTKQLEQDYCILLDRKSKSVKTLAFRRATQEQQLVNRQEFRIYKQHVVCHGLSVHGGVYPQIHVLWGKRWQTMGLWAPHFQTKPGGGWWWWWSWCENILRELQHGVSWILNIHQQVWWWIVRLFYCVCACVRVGVVSK